MRRLPFACRGRSVLPNREIGIPSHRLISGYEVRTSFLATILKSPFWRRDLYRLPSMIDLSIPFQDGTSCKGPKSQQWSRVGRAQIQPNENGLPPLQSHRGYYTAYRVQFSHQSLCSALKIIEG